MAETLRYGLDRSGIYLEVPATVLGTALDIGEQLNLALDKPANQRLIELKTAGEQSRLVLNTKRAGYNDGSPAIVGVLAEIEALSEPEQADPRLELRFGLEPSPVGALGMMARVAWSSATDRLSQRQATLVMQRTAGQLHWGFRATLPDLVWADINRRRGASLVVNPAAGSALATDGQEYDPTQSVMTMYGRHLNSHDAQLICLAGLISVARL